MRFLLALLLLTFPLFAADITPGYTFVSGEQNVTHTKLNLLGAGTINASFLSGKSTVTDPPSTYYLLLYDPSSQSFFKSTLQSAVYNSQNSISNRTENTTPSTNAFFAIYTQASGLTEKTSLRNAFFEHDFLINGRDTTNTTNTGASVLLYDGTGYFKTKRTNLFHGLFPSLLGADSFTNTVQKTTLTNQDGILIWDAAGGSNRFTTISNLFNGHSASTNTTNADSMVIFIGASNVTAQVPMSSVKFFVTNGVTPYYANFSTSSIPAAGAATSAFTHGFSVFGAAVAPTLVQCTLICNNATGDAGSGYALGDEIPIESAFVSGYTGPLFSVIRTTTGITLRRNATAAPFFLPVKTTGAVNAAVTDETHFVLKVRAWYHF